MKDFHERWKDRLEERRSKAANWRSLLIKILILIAIVYFASKFTTQKNIEWAKSGKPDSTTTQTGP